MTHVTALWRVELSSPNDVVTTWVESSPELTRWCARHDTAEAPARNVQTFTTLEALVAFVTGLMRSDGVACAEGGAVRR